MTYDSLDEDCGGKWLVATDHSDYEIDLDNMLFVRKRRNAAASRLFAWDVEGSTSEVLAQQIGALHCNVGAPMVIYLVDHPRSAYIHSTPVRTITKVSE